MKPARARQLVEYLRTSYRISIRRACVSFDRSTFHYKHRRPEQASLRRPPTTAVSPAIDVRLSYRGADVVATLERIAEVYGRPKRIRVDNGPEFISKDLDLWAWLHGVELDFSRPGKPTDNSFAESFNGRFRAECSNTYWFLSLDDARLKCEAWRRDYNEVRPHSAIGNQTPMARAFASGQACLT